MSITAQLLLTFFAALAPVSGGVRDLCDVVYDTTGASIYCEPHGDGAPVFDADVCCDKESCTAAGDRCPTGKARYYCEFGELLATAEVACYFEVPKYCDAFPCAQEPPPGFSWYPQADTICCEYGACVPYVFGSGSCPEESLFTCASLVCNGDGTVTCIDWEE